MSKVMCLAMALCLGSGITHPALAQFQGDDAKPFVYRPLLKVDGKVEDVRIFQLDDQGQMQILGRDESDDSPLKISAEDVVSWGEPVPPARGIKIALVTGGHLIADLTKGTEEELTIDSNTFGEQVIKVKDVSELIFHRLPAAGRSNPEGEDSEEPGDRALLKQDQILLTNGDKLSGAFQGCNGMSVVLQTNLGAVDVEVERIAAVRFRASRRAAAQPPTFILGTADGSVLWARELKIDFGEVKVLILGDDAWTTHVKSVVFFQQLAGKVTYLSDLKAKGYKHIPFLSQSWNYSTDGNVSGGQLKADGRLYCKGIGMHSASRLTYDLGGKFDRFHAELAIDDETQGKGSVVFRVYADNKLAYESATIRGWDKPVPISVDVRGAKQLSLLVDFADRGDEMDRADWLNARLVQRQP